MDVNSSQLIAMAIWLGFIFALMYFFSPWFLLALPLISITVGGKK